MFSWIFYKENLLHYLISYWNLLRYLLPHSICVYCFFVRITFLIDILPCHMIIIKQSCVLLSLRPQCLYASFTWSAVVGWPVAGNRCPRRLRCCPAGVWPPDSSPVPRRHCSTCKIFCYFCRSREWFFLLNSFYGSQSRTGSRFLRIRPVLIG